MIEVKCTIWYWKSGISNEYYQECFHFSIGNDNRLFALEYLFQTMQFENWKDNNPLAKIEEVQFRFDPYQKGIQ